ncbi:MULTISPECIES: DUF3540 domain-containing protein [unclassified Ectothiorhodospira]|uniref:DUF3540 domain-containing protein n=1 Tax=unclassified Ectothiorhodospira TaxID=2684909 RepID=UPI001EE8E235|nr:MULTISPECIES: DUF3540 domain-containing protein [unclassified Ectothiorhodospira]MCG5515923.1 DUF3540 domain-containing protein [Ectothiorhodospira sp. 9100]MCG5518474.1 DUF3540 domain-containing protein [Ectothiorhodospira sp. 9905]
MQAKDILLLDPNPQSSPANTRQVTLARVVQAQAGEALWVDCEGTTVCPMAHAQSTPALRPGDRVLVLLQPATGPVILDRLRRHGEAPPSQAVTERDGHVQLRAERGLYLRCGESSMTLDPTGRMEMRGRELHGIMARLMHFLAARIHFN